MRKVLKIFLSLLLILLVSCSKDEKDKASNNKGKNEETVDVDKGLMNVEITLPASTFEGQDIDEVIAEAKKDGVKEVIQNEDGSLTYKMSKAKHNEMMKKMGASITESVEEMKNSEDYPSIKDVTNNKSFTEFTVEVDREAYENSMDGFGLLGLAISGMMYQQYNGIDPNENKVKIVLKDHATQEVIDEVIYPDAFNEEEEEAETAS